MPHDACSSITIEDDRTGFRTTYPSETSLLDDPIDDIANVVQPATTI
jgi:hypothetical protein